MQNNKLKYIIGILAFILCFQLLILAWCCFLNVVNTLEFMSTLDLYISEGQSLIEYFRQMNSMGEFFYFVLFLILITIWISTALFIFYFAQEIQRGFSIISLCTEFILQNMYLMICVFIHLIVSTIYIVFWTYIFLEIISIGSISQEKQLLPFATYQLDYFTIYMMVAFHFFSLIVFLGFFKTFFDIFLSGYVGKWYFEHLLFNNDESSVHMQHEFKSIKDILKKITVYHLGTVMASNMSQIFLSIITTIIHYTVRELERRDKLVGFIKPHKSKREVYKRNGLEQLHYKYLRAFTRNGHLFVYMLNQDYVQQGLLAEKILDQQNNFLIFDKYSLIANTSFFIIKASLILIFTSYTLIQVNYSTYYQSVVQQCIFPVTISLLISYQVINIIFLPFQIIADNLLLLTLTEIYFYGQLKYCPPNFQFIYDLHLQQVENEKDIELELQRQFEKIQNDKEENENENEKEQMANNILAND